MKSILWYAGLALLVLFALRLLVLVLEPRMVFFPFAGESETPRHHGLSFREIAIETADHERLVGWFLARDAPLADVVFLHGNGGNLSLWLDVVAEIYRQGFAVLALDYRGYGKSTGTPSEQGLYRDTEAAVRVFWDELHRPGNKVVYWGRSLGATMAAYATTVRAPDGLILESAFPSKRSVILTNPVLLALNVFSRYEFPTSRLARGFKGPTLVVHGDADTIIPFRLGRAVFDALDAKKQFLVIPGADHNDFQGPGRKDYWQGIKRFVDEIRTNSASS